jgi:hypothetical protein
LNVSADLDATVARAAPEQLLVNDGNGFFTDETAARIAVLDDTGRNAAFHECHND